jgi:small subunit ribosomal protein S16
VLPGADALNDKLTLRTNMAVAIRLRREGARNSPYYKIVVADQRKPRDGKFIEIIGSYDPKKKGDNFTLELERADYWVSVGARPSQTVGSIITKARKKATA